MTKTDNRSGQPLDISTHLELPRSSFICSVHHVKWGTCGCSDTTLKEPSAPKRVPIAISPDEHTRLKSLKRQVNAGSISEVMRRALTVYQTVIELKHEGWTLQAVKGQGKMVTTKEIIIT